MNKNKQRFPMKQEDIVETEEHKIKYEKCKTKFEK